MKRMSLVVLSMSFASSVYAQAAAAPGKQPSIIETFVIPMLVVLAIMYFVMIRPQQKKNQELASMINSLKPGDEVVTSAGIIGKIKNVNDSIVSLDLGGSTIKILKSHISGPSSTKVSS